MKSYPLGKPVTLTATLRRTDTDALVDPAEVTFEVIAGNGAITTKKHTLGELNHISLGVFELEVETTATGFHYWSVEGDDPSFDTGKLSGVFYVQIPRASVR